MLLVGEGTSSAKDVGAGSGRGAGRKVGGRGVGSFCEAVARSFNRDRKSSVSSLVLVFESSVTILPNVGESVGLFVFGVANVGLGLGRSVGNFVDEKVGRGVGNREGASVTTIATDGGTVVGRSSALPPCLAAVGDGVGLTSISESLSSTSNRLGVTAV